MQALTDCSHIELHPRYDYFKFISLLRGIDYLVTDGGSNQEECSYLGVPCLLLRKASERKEGLGQNAVLSKYDPALVQQCLQAPERYRCPPLTISQSPSAMVVDALASFI